MDSGEIVMVHIPKDQETDPETDLEMDPEMVQETERETEPALDPETEPESEPETEPAMDSESEPALDPAMEPENDGGNPSEILRKPNGFMRKETQLELKNMKRYETSLELDSLVKSETEIERESLSALMESDIYIDVRNMTRSQVMGELDSWRDYLNELELREGRRSEQLDSVRNDENHELMEESSSDSSSEDSINYSRNKDLSPPERCCLTSILAMLLGFVVFVIWKYNIRKQEESWGMNITRDTRDSFARDSFM